MFDLVEKSREYMDLERQIESLRNQRIELGREINDHLVSGMAPVLPGPQASSEFPPEAAYVAPATNGHTNGNGSTGHATEWSPVSDAEKRVVKALLRNQNRSVASLCKHTGINRGYMYMILSRLKKAGVATNPRHGLWRRI